MNPNKRKRLFIYIKNKLISNALNFMLTDNSFEVNSFVAQKEFLKQVSQCNPDIIIFDYKPEADKEHEEITDLYVKLKLSFPQIPIILLFSSSDRDKIKLLLEKTQPDAMIRKPFKLMELLDKTNKILYAGDLEECPFAFLIQIFYDEKRTGVLHLTIEGTKYFVYFIDGQIVYIEFGLRKDTLGMLLLRCEKITEEQYNNALKDASKNHSKLGVSLIKLGYLTPGELNEALENQVYEKIINCFADKPGTFSFKFLDRFIEDIVIYKKDTEKIIFEGVKRHYDIKRLDKFLKTVRTKKIKIKNNMQSALDVFCFNTSEAKIISKLKSMCLYDELALKDSIDKTLLSQILFTLSVTRFLVVAKRKEELVEDDHTEAPAEKKIDEFAYLKEEARLKEMVCEAYLKIKAADYYDTLDITRDDDQKTIKAAYMKSAKKYHPDKYSKKSNDIVQKTNEIFAKVTNAFNTLSDTTAKKEYDYSLDHPKEAEMLSHANEIIQSESEFLKGQKLLKVKEFKKAEYAFEVATKMNPKEPEYKCFYGWAHFLNHENEKAEKIRFAKRLINEAIEANPEIGMAYFFLGSIANFEHNLTLAKKHFKKALKINPNNRAAGIMLKTIQDKAKK